MAEQPVQHTNRCPVTNMRVHCYSWGTQGAEAGKKGRQKRAKLNLPPDSWEPKRTLMSGRW